MIFMPRRFLILCASLCLLGCTASINHYQNHKPSFDVFEYFQGKIFAWGMVQDFRDQQTRRFFVSIEGRLAGDTLILDEQFTYHDGSREQRRWQIRKNAEKHYVGLADDIHGTAVGVEQGNALRWSYAMDVMVDQKPVRLDFDDWMYRQDERHVFNISTLKKFGIEVARVTLFFRKQSDTSSQQTLQATARQIDFRF